MMINVLYCVWTFCRPSRQTKAINVYPIPTPSVPRDKIRCILWRTLRIYTTICHILSALLAFCEGNPPVAVGFPSKGSVTRSFDAFFDLHLHKRMNKQSKRRWFETPSRSLWRHCNGSVVLSYLGGSNGVTQSYTYQITADRKGRVSTTRLVLLLACSYHQNQNTWCSALSDS